jgi:hypothetical protein
MRLPHTHEIAENRLEHGIDLPKVLQPCAAWDGSHCAPQQILFACPLHRLIEYGIVKAVLTQVFCLGLAMVQEQPRGLTARATS